VKVFAVVYSDNFAALSKDELTTNYSRCSGIYSSREKALAAAEAEAVGFNAGGARKIIMRKAVPKYPALAADDMEVFQAVCVIESGGTTHEVVEGSFHVTEHEIELDERPPTPKRRAKRRVKARSAASSGHPLRPLS
jgi:hypothetical protein